MTCGCCGTSCVSARPACVARRRRSMPACRWRSLRRSWGTGRRVLCSLTWASQRTTCGRPASRWSRDLLLRGSRTQHPRSAARSGGMAVVRSDRDRVSRSPFGLAHQLRCHGGWAEVLGGDASRRHRRRPRLGARNPAHQRHPQLVRGVEGEGAGGAIGAALFSGSKLGWE